MVNDYACYRLRGREDTDRDDSSYFPKYKKISKWFLRLILKARRCILVFTCSGARHTSTYYLKSNLREGLVETLDVVGLKVMKF